jgi:DNA-binding transcriptional regulator WhiA
LEFGFCFLERDIRKVCQRLKNPKVANILWRIVSSYEQRERKIKLQSEF